MQRNFLEIFKGKLNTHRIQTKVLALEAGRNASYLSEVFTGKKSPTLETFTALLEAADRLSQDLLMSIAWLLLAMLTWIIS